MVSIEDCSSKLPLPQQLKGDGWPPDDSKSSGADQSTGKENHVPVILAKAAVAAKRQIISGMGICGKAAPQPEGPSSRAEGSGGLSMPQSRFNEDDMVRNLKGIVADDSRWELFALGALGMQPGTESCDTLKNCLLKGFKEDAWDGIANLVALYSKSASNDENTRTSAPPDDLSAGLIERTKLWLKFTDYFETLFSAVQKKSLPQEMKLYTSELLIKYLGTIGQ